MTYITNVQVENLVIWKEIVKFTLISTSKLKLLFMQAYEICIIITIM